MGSVKRFLVWLYILLILAFSLGGFGLYWANRRTPVPPSWGVAGGARDGFADLVTYTLNYALLPLVLGAINLLIERKNPGHPINRWFVGLSLLTALSGVITEYAVFGYFTTAAPALTHIWAAWFTNWLWIAIWVLMLWSLAVFPDGALLPGRWGGWIRVVLVLFVGPMFLANIADDPLSSAFRIPSPVKLPFLHQLYRPLFVLGRVFMAVASVVVSAAVLARYRLQRGRARQQIKWLMYGASLWVGLLLLGFSLRYVFGLVVGDLLVSVSYLGPLLGIGVAILRFRLYDIDLVIRRTLQYSLLTGLLSLVYFGGVALLQSLLSAIGGQRSSSIVIVITTLAIAALFNPLRIRIQDFIDRRFYRQKYDAERALENFTDAARDETDLQALTAKMVSVVNDTLQPVDVSFWSVKGQD